MANTFPFLKTAWHKAKNNAQLVSICLILLTLPLHFRFNSIAIILFVLVSLYPFKTAHFLTFKFTKTLLLPIVLFGLMLLSLFWSIDFDKSVAALGQQIILVIFPVCFLIKPIKSQNVGTKILEIFSYGMAAYGLFYVLHATFRFIETQNTEVFFYHELVTFELNAIYVSVFVAMAFFGLYTKTIKSKIDYLSLLLLGVVLILLSSKNIIIVFFLLLISHLLLFRKHNARKVVLLFAGFFIVLSIGFFSKIKDRFWVEIQSNSSQAVTTTIIPGGLVNTVSVHDAWFKPRFELNDYFPGAAIRVYQARIFFELLQEDAIFFTGYGLDATKNKIIQKQITHNLYPEYGTFNFHNQYLQTFAEIGFFGFLIVVIMLLLSLKNAIKTKNFCAFVFAVLMISVFFTESFLMRVRGLVFFTVLFCIFNTIFAKTNPTKNQ